MRTSHGPQHYPDNGLVSGTRGEVSRNQEVSWSVIFRRKDSMNCLVNVLIWVSYFDDIHRHPIYSEAFVREEMLPDDEL
ncbi:hypothetical protein AVEN_66597-1 [Araneus ventricosus]|uniref:Uncharacterized protein n=1 Tax=Araneus ventricosus TaxID=182803 RepID=A0A4Y2M0P9_ARAVE|nr:hypothetical protein AVEN_66597-1 [Araneus ventricosus]